MKQLKLPTLTLLAGLIILACAMFIGVGSASAAHYSITYNSGLVSDMPADISDASIAENVTLPSTEPTRSGYRFNGWCTIADSSTCEGGTIYTAGSTWALSQTSPTNRLTLYATWQRAGYTVTISLTNPINAYHFDSGTIYDDYETAYGNFYPAGNIIGSIDSASSSTTVMTTTGKISIALRGGTVDSVRKTVTTSSAINYVGEFIASGLYEPAFTVAGNGTITIDGIDWDDD